MAQNNPFTDGMKQFFDAQYPAVDTSKLLGAGKKNFETVSASAQILNDGIQKIARRGAEIFQANSEGALDLFKQVVSSKDPKETATKQVEFAKKTFEKGLSEARELSEIFFKANSEAYELLGKQFTDNVNEATKQASEAAKKVAGSTSSK